MAPDPKYDALVSDLVALGRELPGPTPTAGLTGTVMTRLSHAPAPVVASTLELLLRRMVEAFAEQRRRAVVLLTALLLALVATPPVRATVAEWFGFGGVIVRQQPTPGPSTAPPPPALGPTISLAEAEALVEFDPVVPAELGAPQGVQVSGDRRLLSMSWDDEGGRAVRLDQFDGRLDFTFAKTAPGVEFTSVAGDFAVWFDEPHDVVVLNGDGTKRTETARLAGHTLIWMHGVTTLRLEGDLSLDRATEIAGSVATVP